MKAAIVFIFLLSYSGISYSQDNRTDSLANYYEDKGMWDSAIKYSYQNITIFENNKDWKSLEKTYSNLGYLAGRLHQYDSALSYFEQAFKIFNNNFPDDSVAVAISMRNYADLLVEIGRIEKGLEIYERAINIVFKHFEKEEKLIPALGLAGVYLNLGHSSQCKFLLDSCKMLLTGLDSTKYFDLYISYLSTLREYYLQLNNYESCIDANLAINILKEKAAVLGYSDYINLAYLYSVTGHKENCEMYAKKSYQLYTKKGITDIDYLSLYSNLTENIDILKELYFKEFSRSIPGLPWCNVIKTIAYYYAGQDNLNDSALLYLNVLKNLLTQLNYSKSYQYAYTISAISRVEKDLSERIIYCKAAISAFDALGSDFKNISINSRLYLAVLFEESNDLDSALIAIQTAISKSISETVSIDINYLPRFEDYNIGNDLIDLYREKILILFNKYKLERNYNELILCQITINSLMKVFDTAVILGLLDLQHLNDELISDYNSICEIAIESAFLDSNLSPLAKYNRIIHFSSRTKSLRSLINHLYHYNNQNDNTKTTYKYEQKMREYFIQYRLGRLEYLDSFVTYSQMRKNMYNAVDIDIITEYYKNLNQVSFEFIGKSLDSAEFHLELQICGLKSIYIISQNKRDLYLEKIFMEDSILELLQSADYSSLYNYNKTLKFMSTTLLTELAIDSIGKNCTKILITADNYLLTLPFDFIVYYKKPLIDKFIINYRFHSLSVKDRNQLHLARTSYLGIAPVFEKKEPVQIYTSNINLRAVKFNTRNSVYYLKPLKESEVEVINIAKLFQLKKLRSKSLVKKQANKSYLTHFADSFSILHIATHGFVVENSELKSGIFLSSSDSNHSAYLFSNLEILNLSLSNTNLVVLSACKTAFGSKSPVDGVFSTCKAFYAAGCRNIIYTTMDIPDKFAKDFMLEFYKKILSNISIDNALRLTKIQLAEAYSNNSQLLSSFRLLIQ